MSRARSAARGWVPTSENVDPCAQCAVWRAHLRDHAAVIISYEVIDARLFFGQRGSIIRGTEIVTFAATIDHCGGSGPRHRSTTTVKVRSVCLMGGLRASNGGHLHRARSVMTMVKPVPLAVPLLKLASETAIHSDDEPNAAFGRRLVIVPSGTISAVNAKPLGHCLSLSIEEPLKPTDPENVPAVCARTIAFASQWDDDGRSGP
jgi:hypothetical protein